MNEVTVIVEGQTEQTFVREVLAPEMGKRSVFIRAALIGKPRHKGGNVDFNRFKKDLDLHLRQRHDTLVTTMFDFYRLSSSWPGRKDIPAGCPPGGRAEIIETATIKAVNESLPGIKTRNRFIPYIVTHEFEALLFSSPENLSEKTGIKLPEIKSVLETCGEPENINDKPETSPSNRLLKLLSAYRKVAMGASVAAATGIPLIREKCPLFNKWLEKVERWQATDAGF
jgi:hypothetical protein